MSNTKGSMLISNANAVGTELVNQLGGTGYKPSEWSDAINLLGISDDDKASALAGITSGSYTGSERGAIKYSNCNAVGAMLNKKFSTNRGFKPVEWESAISKLTPLAEGTVSGAICNIVNGADDVPVSSWQVTLPASLDGYSAIRCQGEDGEQTSIFDATASLGRTIYGGTADVVNGTGSEPIIKYTVSSFSGTWGAVGNGYGYYITVADTTHNTAVVEPTMMVANQLFTYGSVGRSNAPTYQYGGNDGGATVHTFILPSEYDTLTKANNFLSNLETPLVVTLTLTTATAFTFTPITPTPETPLGVSNWWADNGDSTITYRKDPDIPDPPVQLLNMNNNNEDNNEGV